MGVDRLFAANDDSWTPKPRKRTVWWLIGITAGIFFLERLIGGAVARGSATSMKLFIEEWFLVSPDGLLAGRVWQLFTYQLFHASGWHLALNMLVLFFLGTLFEDLRGSRNLLRTYFLCGAFAGLACFLEGGPVIGASGSILALLLVLAVQIPNQQVILLFFPVRMKWVAVIIVSLDVLQIMTTGDRTGVAHFAHLAGALAGFAYAWIWPQMINPRVARATERHRRKREVAAMEKALEEHRELDRILDKISRVGINDLTEEERRFLKRTSRKLQESRRP